MWREERLAAAAECRKNDKGLNDGLHWLVWLYCHKGGERLSENLVFGFQTTFVLSGLNGFL